jgi:eukaryotic-like serine/threonine-protein kinase
MARYLPDTALARLQSVATWPEFGEDRYTILDEIGRGGMGAVYLAFDTELQREVAIKVSNGLPEADVERRLKGEARILAGLEHPGIVPVHDTGRLADGRLFYVMKRVRGATLTRYSEQMLTLSERLGVFERICDAVNFAHARGVIHRDLKPDNVMIGEFGEVLVMDFGLARAVAGPDERGAVLGTRGFMAPEQEQGRDVDARADVYALGAILSWLCEGSKVPRSLRSIGDRAMAAAPGDRYESAATLAADVARYRAGLAVEAHRESWIERVGRFGRTYRVAILLVLAYILMRALVAYFRS